MKHHHSIYTYGDQRISDGRFLYFMEMVARQQDMRIPSERLPRCPVYGEPMSMNLRYDATYVEDETCHTANERYDAFLQRHRK